ncbi:MAG: hypothetical protein JRJ84_19665 [Deltaproteobacteria bacterium]|nr:hypothetical protein [Deltaproteobacteria bacterium]
MGAQQQTPAPSQTSESTGAAQVAPDTATGDQGRGDNAFAASQVDGGPGAGSETPTLDAAARTWNIDLSILPYPPGSQLPSVLVHRVETWPDLATVASYLRNFLTSNRCHPKPGAILYELQSPLHDEWRALQRRTSELETAFARHEEQDPTHADLDLGMTLFDDDVLYPLESLLERTAAETSNLYVIREGGSSFRYLTEPDYQAERAQALQDLRDEALPALEARLDEARMTLEEFERINQESGVTAWVSSWFNPMDSPSEDQWDNASVVLGSTRRVLAGDDLDAAVRAVAGAEFTFNTMVTAVNRYIEGAQAGAGIAIVLLQITQTTAFAVASGCAGATFLANAGVAANMAFNTGTAVVQNVAGQAGNMIFLDEDFDWGSLAWDVGLAAGGSAFQDVVVPRIMGDLPTRLAQRFPRASRQVIEELLENMGQNTIGGIATDAANLARGEITYEELLMNVAINIGATMMTESMGGFQDDTGIIR